jgi:hypothetical protein
MAIQFPFEVYWTTKTDPEPYVDIVVQSLRPQTLILPKGDGFLTYERFQDAYEVLKRHTQGFSALSGDQCWTAMEENGLAYVVLRCIVGLSPPELARIAAAESGIEIDQSFARIWDRKLRNESLTGKRLQPKTLERLQAITKVACRLIEQGVPDDLAPDFIHRLDKADTSHGTESAVHLADHGAPYSVVLYERFLGRPFASHRDAVSELIGDIMENAIEEALSSAHVSFRKTKRAEKVPGFDQAPDFFIPDEFHPRVVIEAKITEDDGTARDKVTRVQHLAKISADFAAMKGRAFQVVACIDGAGFAVRKSNLAKILDATQGKTFTLSTLDRLVDCTDLRELRTHR